MKKVFILFIAVIMVITGCSITKEKEDDSQYTSVGTTEGTEDQPDGVGSREEKEDEHGEIKNPEEDSKEQVEENIVIEEEVGRVKKGEEKVLDKIDDITLVAILNDYGTMNGLKVHIDDEEDKIIEVASNPIMGGHLKVMDINQDKKKDIIVYEYIGGSGNIQNIYVYENQDDGYNPVMSPDDYVSLDNFYHQYLGEGIIFFEDKNTDFKVTYDILVPYENENWTLEEVQKRFGMTGKAWVDPYSAFEIEDIDDDGIYEIKASQIICGVAHVDLVGEMTTIYKYNDNKYAPYEVIYYKVEHKEWQREEIGRKKVK